MQSPRFKSNARTSAFTLVEMLIVITIIALLAALTMGGYTYAMRSSKRRITTGTFEAIKLALERYSSEFAEYPEPTGGGQSVSLPPGPLTYDVSGATCLYQALTGDGYDHIKGVTGSGSNASGTSDGKVEGVDEIKGKMFADIPQTIFSKKGSTYFLIDGFGHPFQYIKAAAASTTTNNSSSSSTTPTTINSTYDLWSYVEDEKNTSKKSIDSLKDANMSLKWIKNW